MVDAYLSPILRRYIDRVAGELGDARLMFMQSNGGLTDAKLFQGKDSILSGPAGGIVSAVRVSAMAGFEKIITFDMGGTSTDVAHFDGTNAIHTHMTNARLTDPEVLEWRFPVVVEDFRVRRGSGGRGRQRGGCGVDRRIRFRQPMTAAILLGHRRIAPYGVGGGDPGALGRNRVERTDGSTTMLSGTDKTEVSDSVVFVIETPGGGFGDAEG